MLHRMQIVLAAASLAFAAMITTAHATEIQLLASTAMREALDALVPQFEKESGHKVTISFYPAATLVLKVKDGAPADIVMTTPDNLTALTNTKHLVDGTRVDFAHSRVGVAVKAGAPKPDIGTPEALKATFLAAKSIGVSRGPSGVHLLGQMAKLGIADQVKAKMVQPDLGVRVGTLVAEGKAEIGVQQVGELLPIKGIVFLGPLPSELQTVIVYGMARSANARQWDAASMLVKYLTAPTVGPTLKTIGLDPA
ncbi:molybdate ABC transporter substrate-binding protein [Rhodoplanes sp. Z2-YC6860]|uniref:molybdate ABC transporter substrate-binding protein n=1 Tax=Rhodoplanes sp. Z2-YC6860 TaxID=674703 RepID=UPI00078DE331|nr:substrate-binding domain-containing protein [Rhodoplanes sp. Z2-YC6860]AMN45256.1 ABC transporter periplasmic substrate-binding protein [Rhodoplanes sp. Z2-YC6860]